MMEVHHSTPKKLPSQEYLLSILSYDKITGYLFHLPKSKSEKRYEVFNGRFAGKRAFKFKTGRGYFRSTVRECRGQFMAHRVIWKMIYGTEPVEIDHIDGNTSNNKIENLRSVDRKTNCRNNKMNRNNTSGISGIHKLGNKWRAIAQIGGKQVHLGMYLDKNSAISARASAINGLGYTKRHGLDLANEAEFNRLEAVNMGLI